MQCWITDLYIKELMEKTIYKLDSKGKLRYLKISTKDNLVVQTSGLQDSPNAVTHESECIGKNIGKSNETTPQEQAILEAKAKIKAKLEEGYYETIQEAQKEVLVLPMLAKEFKAEEDKVSYPFYVQPKLDGMRCLKKEQNLISRKNKEIDTMSHIANELKEFADAFDGELYAHGLSFQDNMKLIKKYRKNESEKVKYHVYDIVLPNMSFTERLALLRTIIRESKPNYIELVPTYIVENKQELLERHKQFLSEGYEGTIIRHGNSGYEINKRSGSLLKFKDFQDLACEIVDVEPSEKRPTHGIFICKVSDGRTFGTGMKFSFEEREEILTNKKDFIGKTAEIRFFEYTDDGLPRFPVCVGIRLDK